MFIFVIKIFKNQCFNTFVQFLSCLIVLIQYQNIKVQQLCIFLTELYKTCIKFIINSVSSNKITTKNFQNSTYLVPKYRSRTDSYPRRDTKSNSTVFPWPSPWSTLRIRMHRDGGRRDESWRVATHAAGDVTPT